MDKNRAKNILLDHIIEILLVLLIIGMTLASPNFLTMANILNILRSSALKGVIDIRIGMHFHR